MTRKNFTTTDPSENHIGVNNNSIRSACAFYLCGGERTTCSFPWTSRAYTSWTDYNGMIGSLEVWFANGSLREGVAKRAGLGSIQIPHLDLMDIFGDYMYVGFSCHSWPFLDTYEIISRNFATGYAEEDIQTLTSRRRLFLTRTFPTCAACDTAILGATCLPLYWTRQPRSNKS